MKTACGITTTTLYGHYVCYVIYTYKDHYRAHTHTITDAPFYDEMQNEGTSQAAYERECTKEALHGAKKIFKRDSFCREFDEYRDAKNWCTTVFNG